MRDKYGIFQDAGCYPGTDVPINKLDIKDAAILEEAEAAFAAASAESIELGTPPFDLAYLCDLHQALFGDVYDWAGHLRSVDIAKGTTRFARHPASRPRRTACLPGSTLPISPALIDARKSHSSRNCTGT